MLCHESCASAEDDPCEKRADNGVSDTDPSRGDTELPAKLTCVADEDNGREVGCAVCEGGEPGTDTATAEDKSVYVLGRVSGTNADVDHYRKENDE